MYVGRGSSQTLYLIVIYHSILYKKNHKYYFMYLDITSLTVSVKTSPALTLVEVERLCDGLTVSLSCCDVRLSVVNLYQSISISFVFLYVRKTIKF